MKSITYEAIGGATGAHQPVGVSLDGSTGAAYHRFEFLAEYDSMIPLVLQGITNSASIMSLAFAVDSTSAIYKQNDGGGLIYNSQVDSSLNLLSVLRDLGRGHHYSVPMRRAYAAMNIYLKNKSGSVNYTCTDVLGTHYC